MSEARTPKTDPATWFMMNLSTHHFIPFLVRIEVYQSQRGLRPSRTHRALPVHPLPVPLFLSAEKGFVSWVLPDS